MKTFQQFCEDSTYLNEFVSSKNIKQSIKNIAQSPVGRFASKVIRLGSRGEGALGVVDPKTGPLEKLVSGVQAVAPPGVSDVAAGLRYTAMQSKPVKKVDAAMQKHHTNAYKLNPQGYARMASGSF